MKRAFRIKQKYFFIIFKTFSVAKTYFRPGSSPLTETYNYEDANSPLSSENGLLHDSNPTGKHNFV